VYLAVQEQDIVHENYADTDSDEEHNDTRLQDPDDNNDSNEDADWRSKLPADRALVHKFIGEQNGLNKEASPDITTDTMPGDYFMLYFAHCPAHYFARDKPLHGSSICCKRQDSSSFTRNTDERYVCIFHSSFRWVTTISQVSNRTGVRTNCTTFQSVPM
jgi:hypothetical protein